MLIDVFLRSPLRHFDLSGNPIEDEGAEQLARALGKSSCSLERLFLSSCSLSQVSVRPLLESLKRHAHMKHLTLDFNQLVGPALPDFITTLWYNHNLRVLSMGGCLMGDRSFGYLIDALSKNKGVQELNVERNSLGAVGAQIVSRMLKENESSLRRLNLSGNAFGEEGCCLIALGIAENKKLQSLLLRNVEMKEPAGLAFLRAVSENPQLVQLDLRENAVSLRTLREIGKTLDQNSR